MNIRKSTSKDKDGIYKLHKNTFGDDECDIVSKLATDLLAYKKSILSLVAEQHNIIFGNIIFSPVQIEDVSEYSIYILAPLAVDKKKQKRGVGTKLINKGMRILKKQNVDVVLVYGDPKYYNRFGFNNSHNIQAPYNLQYKNAWMAYEISTDVIKNIQGIAQCIKPLCSQKLW
jgi:putative acetyltransferase